MRNIIAVVLMICVAVMGLNTYGDISLKWQSLGGAYSHDGVSAPSWLGLRQLIWCATDLSAAMPSASDPNHLVAGEVLLRTYVAGSEDYAYWDFAATGGYDPQYNNASVGGADIKSGYVYSRIFNSTAPEWLPAPDPLNNNNWYYVGAVEATAGMVDYNPMDADATSYFVNATPVGVVVTLNSPLIAVPEPTTLAMLGLGALLLGIRRFRK